MIYFFQGLYRLLFTFLAVFQSDSCNPKEGVVVKDKPKLLYSILYAEGIREQLDIDSWAYVGELFACECLI